MQENATRKAIYIGKLKDLGLGNPDGIPSVYADSSDDQMSQVANDAAQKLVDVTDEGACACIDGRHTNGNADGSAAQLRLRRVWVVRRPTTV